MLTKRLFSCVGLCAALVCTFLSPAGAQAPRDPWVWPFAPNSIWNTPIGSGAQYVAANLGTLDYVSPDPEFLVRVTTADPSRTLYFPGGPYRANSTSVSWLGTLRLPDSFLVSDIDLDPQHYSTPNDVSTFLQPDGFSLIQLQPTTRVQVGGPIWGFPQIGGNAGTNLFADGIRGTHYGSGLSGIGGSLRAGELTSPAPIQHAVKWELTWTQLYHNRGDSTNDYQTYRWPAANSDGGADNAGGGYSGTNPVLQMGSLLAIKPTETEQSLGLTTAAGKKLFHALQDYGAYIVDTSSNVGNGINIAGEDGLQNEITGWGGSGNFYNDINTLYTHLYVVNNNGPTSVGGGGTPRRSAPPPFAYAGSAVGVIALSVPGTIPAASYDVGGEGGGYHSGSGVSLGNTYRNDGVGVVATQDTGGGYQIGQTAPGQWLKYSVSATAGTYDINFRVSSGANGGTLHLEDENGSNLTGPVSIGGTGSDNTFTTDTVSGVTLTGGNHVLKLVEDTGGYNIHWFSVGGPPVIIPDTVASLTLAPATLVAGQSALGTLTLTNPAPSGGVTVTLTSSDPAAVIPATAAVAAGQTTVTFPITTNPVSAATTATLTGALNGSSQTATLTIQPLVVSALALSPASVLGGSTSTATVTLNGPAPAGGVTVTLASDNATATVPASVSIPAGAASATFHVTTQIVAASTTARISASSQGASQTTALTIQPYAVIGLSLNPASVLVGSSSTATVTLNAPAGGLPVGLSSDSAAAVVPPTILVPAGQSTATFPVTTRTVSTPTTANLTAALPGGAKTAALTVSPNGVSALTLSPPSAPTGATITGIVTLSGPAPTGGETVGLVGAAPGLAPVPDSVTVPAGQSAARFTFTAGAALGTATAQVTASASGGTRSATLTIQGVTLQSLAFTPAQVPGGRAATGTLTLSGPAPPGGAPVALSSPSALLAVPATVTVPGGASAVNFNAGTSPVSAAATLTVTASAGGASASGQLTVTPVPGTVFGSGTRMISVPMDYPGVPVADLLGAGVKLYRWVPPALTYAVLPNPPADALRLGRGYWVRLGGGATVTRLGTPADATQDFPIPLEKGWNQIGDPFFVGVPVGGLKVVSGGQSRPLSASAALVDSPLYVYNPGGAGTPGQYLPAGSLDAGQGYWIHATAPVTLVVPHT